MSKELEALRTIGNIRVKETYSDEPSKVSDLKTLFNFHGFVAFERLFYQIIIFFLRIKLFPLCGEFI